LYPKRGKCRGMMDWRWELAVRPLAARRRCRWRPEAAPQRVRRGPWREPSWALAEGTASVGTRGVVWRPVAAAVRPHREQRNLELQRRHCRPGAPTMSSKRRSVGMSRSAINNVFEDVFASTVKTGTSHSVTHGDASRRETSAFGPDLHDPRDLSGIHRGGDSVSDTLNFIEAEQAEPPPVVAVETNGCVACAELRHSTRASPRRASRASPKHERLLRAV
jgi:hypothetical protein